MTVSKIHVPAGRFFWSLLVFAALTFGAAAQVRHGNDSFQAVVIAPDAPDTVKYAAQEWRHYVEKMTGGKPALYKDGKLRSEPAVYIGESEAAVKLGVSPAGLKTDGFVVRTLPKALVLIGHDYKGRMPICGFRDPWHKGGVWNEQLKLCAFGDSGSLFAVYHVLQHYCGIRWYMPGPLGEVVPKKPQIDLPDLNLRVEPEFSYRFPSICRFSFCPNEAKWYKRLRFGAKAPLQINHSFKYFKSIADGHPEYYAFVDGRRSPDGKGCSGYPHFCLTNPGVVKAFADKIIEYFDNNPEQVLFPVMPGDGLWRICECPKCQAELNRKVPWETGAFSNHIWKFINEVAKLTAKKHPDKFIGGAAYHKHSDLPDFPIEPNVFVLISKRRGSLLDPAYRRDMYKRIDDWHRAVGGRLVFWDYYLDSRLPWTNLPAVDAQMIADDLRHLKSLGVAGEYIESGLQKGRYGFPGVSHLNHYLTAQLYWNVDQDPAELLEEYYRLFYGPAQAEMREFWQTAIERRREVGLKKMKGLIGTVRNWLYPGDVFPPPVLSRMKTLLEQAVAKTEPDSVYRKRILLVKNEFDAGAKSLETMVNVRNAEYKLSSAPGVYQGFSTKMGMTEQVKTWMSMRSRGGNLEIEIIGYDPDMEKLKKVTSDKKKKIWSQDGVEMFIMPDPADQENGWQFFFALDGRIMDARRQGRRAHENWESGAKTQIRMESCRWVMRIILPLEKLKLKPGKTFLLNAYRYRQAGRLEDGSNISAWSPTGQFLHFCPDRFGMVEWTEPPKPAGNVRRPQYFSGNRRMTLWNPGGLEGKKPAVGLVNSSRRNDLLMMFFDLNGYLAAGKVKRASLQLTLTPHSGKQTRKYLLEYLKGNVLTPRKEDLAGNDTERIAEITVKPGKTPTVFKADLTDLVNRSLAAGHPWCKLRLLDDDAEKRGNIQRKAAYSTVRAEIVIEPE
ncbi:MAG: DUF4838 domain-containing protein [Lentisphaeria bacterium]|nr:DUF4838 domain-containing protein [Lentisphaeria bacterium]